MRDRIAQDPFSTEVGYYKSLNEHTSQFTQQKIHFPLPLPKPNKKVDFNKVHFFCYINILNIIRIRKATRYATTNGYTILNKVHLREPVSLRIVATVDIQGIYKLANTTYVIADNVVNAAAIPTSPPYKTIKLDTTISFAKNPLIRLLVACHDPNPSGENTGAITDAMILKKLSFESTSIPAGPMLLNSHKIILPINMKLPAFLIKRFAFSSAWYVIVRNCGNR